MGIMVFFDVFLFDVFFIRRFFNSTFSSFDFFLFDVFATTFFSYVSCLDYFCLHSFKTPKFPERVASLLDFSWFLYIAKSTLLNSPREIVLWTLLEFVDRAKVSSRWSGPWGPFFISKTSEARSWGSNKIEIDWKHRTGILFVPLWSKLKCWRKFVLALLVRLNLTLFISKQTPALY